MVRVTQLENHFILLTIDLCTPFSQKMAELQTPSAAAMFDGNVEKKKPEKPDEELYKVNLKKAEKEHADSMAKFVCCVSPSALYISRVLICCVTCA